MKDPFEIYQDNIKKNIERRNVKPLSTLLDVSNVQSHPKRHKIPLQPVKKVLSTFKSTNIQSQHRKKPKVLHFEVLENRGLAKKFNNIDHQFLNSNDLIVSNCENSLKLIVDWFKISNFDYESKEKEGNLVDKPMESDILRSILKSDNKYQVKATHKIIELEKLGNSYMCKVTDGIVEKKVLMLCLIDIELHVNDEINLNNLHFIQNGSEYYLKWERIIK
ncbi:unnamed protein product [Candida verbasci]|uniref:Uncharacterized protein n=1 Tax=Candida verbasci TaxID=1227364 RepID=A0A9W4X9Q2_9ASCO|nr:unnamed protein product [Candida verbasci]